MRISRIIIAALGVCLVFTVGTVFARSKFSIAGVNGPLELQARPDLGYVYKTTQDTDESGKDIDVNATVKPVKGLRQRGLWIVENTIGFKNQQANSTTKKLIQTNQYSAPFFLYGSDEPVIVIPEIVTKLKAGIGDEQLTQLCQSYDLNIIKKMDFADREYLLEVMVTDAEGVFLVVEKLNKQEIIEWAALNFVFKPQLMGEIIPNDTYFDKQWHLRNTGQGGGTKGADIRIAEAWEITTGDPNIIIAIIDDGVQSTQPDLVDNLAAGYDFYDDDDLPDPYKYNSDNAHGTACAGIAGAKGDNGIGVAGVCWNCGIMPIRIVRSNEWIGQADIATAIRWAANNGADVMSLSWGSSLSLEVIHSAIIDVTKIGGIGRNGKGCIVVSASGNSGGFLNYPAAYMEVIAVGATDYKGNITDYSCYGPGLDLVAPGGYYYLAGQGIWTTDLIDTFGYNNNDPGIFDYTDKMGGTSAACPIIAGVAALILSLDSNLENEEVREILCNTARDIEQPGYDNISGYGFVNAFAAVSKQSEIGNIIYVDDDANGIADGSSWENAFKCLANALAVAQYDEEIHVAQGVYKPDQNQVMLGDQLFVESSGDRQATFQIVDGTVLKGGFAGIGADDPNERDFEKYLSILSGDLVGDDIEVEYVGELGDEPSRTENSYNVVSFNDVGEETILDGFIITAGNADGPDLPDFTYHMGGGIVIIDSDPKVINCTLINNSSSVYGGAFVCESQDIFCHAEISDCQFIDNYSEGEGGALNNFYAYIKITDSQFKGNIGNIGGAITNESTEATIRNCLFIENSSETFGGGMVNTDSYLILSNSTFAQNSATNGYSMAFESERFARSIAEINNCILWDEHEAIANNDNSDITITYSDIYRGNIIVPWSGEGNIIADPCFVDVNSGDFHLKSQAGRWDAGPEAWVVDSVHSLCIDTGDPNSNWQQEYWPHGGRINMGYYGGTHQASMSLSQVGSAADLNLDNHVDSFDLELLANKWLSDEPLLREDINRNGSIDFSDFNIFSNSWYYNEAP